MIPIIFVIIFIIIDQVVKYLTLTNLQNASGFTFIPHFMEFIYVENRGAAFGSFQGAIPFFIPLTLIIVGVLVYYYRKLNKDFPNNIIRIALLCIISGAIGNLLDRAFRGYVVDTFHFLFVNFPVFNVADILVVVGSFLMVITTLLYSKDK